MNVLDKKTHSHHDDPYWSQFGETWVRTLPARTIAEFASGNCPPLMVLEARDGVRVLDTGSGTQTTHPSLDEARRHANRIAQDLLESRDGRMLAEAGLDPAEWRFCHQGRFVWFQSLRSPNVRLERHDSSRWVAIDGRLRIGIAHEPSLAADLVRQASLRPGYLP